MELNIANEADIETAKPFLKLAYQRVGGYEDFIKRSASNPLARRVKIADLEDNIDLRRLKFITKLKVLGLSLAEMQELETLYRRHRTNAKVLPRLIELLDAHLATTGERINELAGLRDEIRSYREHVSQRLLEEDAR